MVPNAHMLNYLYWLRQRGQVFPRARPRGSEPAVARRSVRFLVVTERDFDLFSESQHTLIERMLAATGLPREDFVFERSDAAALTLLDANVEGVLCLGRTALAAISSHSFEAALQQLLTLPERNTLVCAIHPAEDMEQDPNLKRPTWQQLLRLVAAAKKEPRA